MHNLEGLSNCESSACIKLFFQIGRLGGCSKYIPVSSVESSILDKHKGYLLQRNLVEINNSEIKLTEFGKKIYESILS
ncbi:MAG: hypothetical protein WCX73_04120 [Candidatus Pacearchaeota archaeon]|jgi:hypothetical protein